MLYSVSCEFVELFMIRVEADDEDEARRLAKKKLVGHGVTQEAYGYVGQMIRAGTVIEVEKEEG